MERGPGSTRQDQNVINRFIQSRGPGLHHLALKLRDINGQLSRLESAGYTLIDAQGRPGSRLAQIGFIHPASLGGLLIHLVEREENILKRKPCRDARLLKAGKLAGCLAGDPGP